MSKRSDAIVDLLYEHRRDKLSRAGYKRITKACKVLEMDDKETASILYHMEYADESGKVHDWALQSR